MHDITKSQPLETNVLLHYLFFIFSVSVSVFFWELFYNSLLVVFCCMAT